jgi:hypothetical protein
VSGAVAENAKTLPAGSRRQPGTDTTRFAHVIKMLDQLEPGCLRYIRGMRIAQAVSARDRADQAAELRYQRIPAGPIARGGASDASSYVIVIEAAGSADQRRK